MSKFAIIAGSITSMTQTRNWMFCSSGARASYLRANVRNLALQPGEIVQFRYKKDIISPNFIKLIEGSPKSFKGHSAYLTYLDNREKGVAPKLFPLRQASILSCNRRGSTYIIKLKVGKYFDWVNLEPKDIQKFIKLNANVPGWLEKNEGTGDWEAVGDWVFEACSEIKSKLIDHDPQTKNHLSSFEAAVDACFTGEDFKNTAEKWIFCNFLGLKTTDCFLTNKTLKAGKSYSFPLYHYKPGSGSHAEFDPFFFQILAYNDNIEFTSPAKLKIESEYDEKAVSFRVKKNAPKSSVTFNISIYCEIGSGSAICKHTSLNFDITYAIKPSIMAQIVGIFGIAVGLFVGQATIFYESGETLVPKLAFIIIGSLIAGYFGYAASKSS